MPLAAGQTLAFYEILGPLGAGGMGEVYRARDARLEREVAIEVLPEDLAGDRERLRRFEREAKTLASLNHPNVAGIHGVDQEGATYFLALELVPGEDLAARLSRGPLPVDEVLDVCRQIAEGLEAAHEAGVVHRDLKPANVRITPEGIVKILDFGLAKPVRPLAPGEGTRAAESDSFLVTEEGLVLGTPTYMSPEQSPQANRQEVEDRRILGPMGNRSVVRGVPVEARHPPRCCWPLDCLHSTGRHTQEKNRMHQQQNQEWIPCGVYPGMFSDELVVEIGERSFFVARDAVRKHEGNRGEVLVTIVEVDGKRWAVVPTSTRETVPLGA